MAAHNSYGVEMHRHPKRAYRGMAVPPVLVELLGDEELRGAACKGMSPLFDADVPGEDLDAAFERLSAARHICGGCPVREACERAGTGLPGVWGGTVRAGNASAYRARERGASA